MGKQCSLCGGKLRNGICTECGMDNRKSDRTYSHHAENIQPAENITAEKKIKRNSVQEQFVFKKQT